MPADFRYPQAVLDYKTQIDLTDVPGASSFGKFGRRSGITAGSVEDIWCGTVTPRIDLPSAERMVLVSTDAADSQTGIGAREMLVFGVDNDWNQIFETVLMQGLTPVTTVNTFLRVNFVIITLSGNGTTVNIGRITIDAELTALATQDVVEPDEGFSCSTHYAVPRGKRILIPNLTASVKKNDEAEIRFKSDMRDRGYIDAFRVYLDEGAIQLTDLSLSFSELTDVKFQCEAITPNVAVDLFYTIIQFDR